MGLSPLAQQPTPLSDGGGFGSVGSWQGPWQDDRDCLNLLGFGKGVWQLIPQLLGLWLYILSAACCLSPLHSPLHPLAAVWSPHDLWGNVRWG